MKATKLVVLSLLCATSALAQGKADKGAAAEKKAEVIVKEGNGEAAILKGDVDKATEQAKQNALRDAVEQAAGVFISSETITENNQILSDQVFSNSQGYVKSYEVLSKGQEGGVAKVKVRANILTQDLDRDLQAVQSLVRKMGKPRMVVFIQEQTKQLDESVTTSKVMSSVLTDAFRQDGWTILDEAFLAKKIQLDPAAGMSTGTVKELGNLTEAGYVLYGRVLFRHQNAKDLALLCAGRDPKDCNFFPVTGEYDLTLFSTSNGTQFGTVTGKFSVGDKGSLVPGTLISYERAAFDLAKQRGKDIVAQVRKEVYAWLLKTQTEGDRVVMNVVGVKEYGSVNALVKVLREQIPGVRGVDFRNYKDEKVELDVTYVGSTDKLAEAIDGAKFKGKRLSVSGRSASGLEVTVGK